MSDEQTPQGSIEPGSTGSQTGFDWGPPISPVSDALASLLTYFFVLALLVGMVVLLVGPDDWDLPVWGGEVDSVEEEVFLQPEPPAAFKAPGSAVGPEFFVQAGAFFDEFSAVEALGEMHAAGFEVFLRAPASDQGLYSVVAGPFRTEFEAEVISRQFNAAEFHSFVLESH